MLNTMRTLSKSIVSKLLMLLLVVSFGIWGVGDILKSGGAPGYAAKVGDESITYGEFDQQRRQTQGRLEEMGMRNLPAGKVELMVIRKLITEKLSLLAMRDMGLYVNDETVGRALAATPALQDENGKFSKVRFSYLLDKQRMKESTFINEFKRDIAGKFLTDSLSMEDAAAPASILTLQAIGAGETRDVVLFTIPASSNNDDANDQALTTYYDAHKDTDYLRPETRDLEYVVLTPAEIDGMVSKSITDDMVNQAMTERKKTSKTEVREQLMKEQRDDAMHDLSNSVEDELAAGKTMGDAFTKAGIHTEPHRLNNATAEMAKTSDDDVTKTVTEQGFGLSEGEISHLITSKKGTLLMVSVKKINAAAPKPFDDVKADVKAHVGKELAADAARAKASAVKKALDKSSDWQAVAADKKVAIRTVAHVGRAMEGHAPLEGISPSLQQAIFEHKVNEVAGPAPTSAGDQVLAFITATHLPQVSAATIKPGKEMQAMSKQLGENVTAHAYQAFSDKHHVEVNPKIMQQHPSEE